MRGDAPGHAAAGARHAERAEDTAEGAGPGDPDLLGQLRAPLGAARGGGELLLGEREQVGDVADGRGGDQGVAEQTSEAVNLVYEPPRDENEKQCQGAGGAHRA
ncbi:hypothetical protein ACFU8I_28120, partial [Streptomyces sp. NPDC057540]|uniref:hypothetical protein n=1 Tax=Streptomyces sp. NPDC057540 TaxID=3346160 RepID=UPI00368F1DE1